MTGVFTDHLSLDAVVAFADGELSLLAYQRAAAHLERCPRCAEEVAEQTVVQQSLREAEPPPMPGSLFDSLRSIPLALPLHVDQQRDGHQRGASARGGQPPPDSLEHHGFLPSSAPFGTGDQHLGRGRRFRVGAGALMAGLAVSAVVAIGAGDHGVSQVRAPAFIQSRPVNRVQAATLTSRRTPSTTQNSPIRQASLLGNRSISGH